MEKFNVYTFYKSDGSKQLLYGTTVENALDNAGFSTEWITENIRDHRKGHDDSLEFLNGKWQPKLTKTKIKIEPHESN